jgi:hypothetical protein
MKKKPTTATRTCPPQAIEPGYLGREDAARYINSSPGWLDRLKASGRIAYFKPSRRKVLYAVADLDAMLAPFRVDPDDPAPFETAPRTRGDRGKFAKGGRK